MDITSPECFWAKTRVLPGLHRRARTSRCSTAPTPTCTTASRASSWSPTSSSCRAQADRWLPQFPPNFFDMILVDEGHHAAAASWQKVFRRFPDAKVVSLTATPFRADEQPLEGELIYRYPFSRAMMNGFIKQIHSRYVAPEELSFTYAEETTRHTLDEVLELREEQWFRRGVALSPECNRHIAEASIQRCNRLRAETGIQHQIIAAACSVDHARQVRAIYEECGYRAAEIHSDMDEDDREAVLERLPPGQIDCIVQVQMLGEGFDHPRLSVAAIFRPFRSLAPYIQFVGRVMRVVIQNDARPSRQPGLDRLARRPQQRGALGGVPRARPRRPGPRPPLADRRARDRRRGRGRERRSRAGSTPRSWSTPNSSAASSTARSWTPTTTASSTRS